jgi:hypothetical protein
MSFPLPLISFLIKMIKIYIWCLNVWSDSVIRFHILLHKYKTRQLSNFYCFRFVYKENGNAGVRKFLLGFSSMAVSDGRSSLACDI